MLATAHNELTLLAIALLLLAAFTLLWWKADK